MELQALIRGREARSCIQRKSNRLRRAEREVVGLQSLIRGQMVRALFVDHLRDYRSTVDWATLVIGTWGGKLIIDSSYGERGVGEKSDKPKDENPSKE